MIENTTGDIVKNIFLIIAIAFCVTAGCDHLPSTGSVLVGVPDVVAEDILAPPIEEDGSSAKEIFIVPAPVLWSLYIYILLAHMQLTSFR